MASTHDTTMLQSEINLLTTMKSNCQKEVNCFQLENNKKKSKASKQMAASEIFE